MGVTALATKGPTGRNQASTCKTCAWLDELDDDAASMARAIMFAATERGEWLFGHRQLAREFSDDGLDVTDTALADHRTRHGNR